MSERNREKLFHDGYMYTFDKFDYSKTIKFWRCDKRYSLGCKARIHTSIVTNEVINQVNDHSHGSDPAKIEVAAFRANVKRRAAETQDTPAEIIKEAYECISPEVKRQLPNSDALKKIIKRKRASMQSSQQ
ncbi:FLYWCH zinc finger domain protein [Trichuris suis]|nr:FLYWCH zinc finger domain protein [Trichuris suis]